MAIDVCLAQLFECCLVVSLLLGGGLRNTDGDVGEEGSANSQSNGPGLKKGY